MIIDIADQFNAVESDIFVCLVNGRFFKADFRPKRATAFQSPCIRAAADGDGGFVFAADLVIDPYQGRDQTPVGIVVDGRLIVVDDVFHAECV